MPKKHTDACRRLRAQLQRRSDSESHFPGLYNRVRRRGSADRCGNIAYKKIKRRLRASFFGSSYENNRFKSACGLKTVRATPLGRKKEKIKKRLS